VQPLSTAVISSATASLSASKLACARGLEVIGEPVHELPLGSCAHFVGEISRDADGVELGQLRFGRSSKCSCGGGSVAKRPCPGVRRWLQGLRRGRLHLQGLRPLPVAPRCGAVLTATDERKWHGGLTRERSGRAQRRPPQAVVRPYLA
jgi:hypothetical protein